MTDKGKHDGKAFFGCLVLIGLIVAMGNDLQQSHGFTPPRKPPIPKMAGIDQIAAAIPMSALYEPVKHSIIQPPSMR